ncbi:hypothetical protein AB7942_29875 [Neobacillus sp. BF23-41]|uniref:hypothetical protein n=1 Tax=Neobacillus sp. BF23-41 TaxID=3240280 RepID=UPI0034E5565F
MANIELIESKKGLLKKVAIPVAAIILFSTGYGFGSNGAKTELNGEKMKYEEVAKEIKSEKEDLKTYKATVKEIQAKIKTVNNDYAARKTEFDEAKKIADSIKGATGQLDTLSSNIESKKKEIGSLDKDIEAKKDELASIEGTIKVKKDAPKSLSAGTYTIGKDIPAGRYKATPVGGGSNLVTFDLEGIPDVNTILGSSGEPSYTFEAIDGYKLQTESAVKLTPIE